MYQGAIAAAMRILDLDLCMMTLLDLKAQPHSSVNCVMRGFWLEVLPFISLIYSWRISQECGTKVTDNHNQQRTMGLKPRECTIRNDIFSHFVWLSYL